jgi:predicted Fe-S protein YdhL (DUF1289 family)
LSDQQVASPCIGVCRIDPISGWCEGCARSLDEIAIWPSANDDQRSEILARIATRREMLAAAGAG